MSKEDKCLAPTFRRRNIIACIFLRIIYAIAVLPWLAFAALFSKKARCRLKQEYFRITHCPHGNSDPDIEL